MLALPVAGVADTVELVTSAVSATRLKDLSAVAEVSMAGCDPSWLL